MANLNCIDDAYLLIEGDKISDFGKMEDMPDFDEKEGFDFVEEEDEEEEDNEESVPEVQQYLRSEHAAVV